MKVPFSLPAINEAEIEQVADTLRSGWLTSGPKVAAFEQAFSQTLDLPNAMAVNSGSSALLLGLKALGFKRGDQALLSSISFCACASAIEHLGGEPVFCDIDPETLNMDPCHVEAALKKAKGRIKVVMAVHMAGQMCDMEIIQDLARRYGAKVLEDAAHTLPGQHLHLPVGHWSDASIFSFYATKPVCAGEGGMLSVKNQDDFERAKKLRFHGIDRDVWDRYRKLGRSWDYDVSEPGYKFNMTEIAAVLATSQLKRADEFWLHRLTIANTYLENIHWGVEISPPRQNAKTTKHSWHLFIIRTNRRDELADYLGSKAIGCSFHFRPLHTMQAWKSSSGVFPEAQRYWDEGLSLPMFNSMSVEQCLYVCSAINEFFE